jgi:hypothetical protein
MNFSGHFQDAIGMSVIMATQIFGVFLHHLVSQSIHVAHFEERPSDKDFLQ